MILYPLKLNWLLSSDRVWIKFFEVFHRFCLVLPTDQHFLFPHITRTLDDAFEAWTKGVGRLNHPQDELAVVQMYIQRLSSKPPLHPVPSMEYISSAMSFTSRSIMGPSYHLIPSLLRETIGYAWAAHDLDGGRWIHERQAFGKLMFNVQ